MRELEQSGMCLGMVSNSGAERRHEYGRRAARKALAGGCWRNKNADLTNMANLFAYLTLKEILIWQHGTDLVSHEMAMRAYRCAQEHSKSGGATAGPNSSSVKFTFKSRRELTEALLAERTVADKTPKDLMMTREEMEAEFDLNEEESPKSRFETGTRHWQKLEPDDDVKYALIGVPYEGECTEASKLPPGVKVYGGKLVYDIEDDRALFNNRDWDVLSEISDENSEDGDEDEERWHLDVNSFDFCEDDDCDGDYRPEPADDSDSDVESIFGDVGSRVPQPPRKKRRCVEGLSVRASAGQQSDGSAGVPCCNGGNSVNQAAQPRSDPLSVFSGNQVMPCVPPSNSGSRIADKKVQHGKEPQGKTKKVS
jgi:hypothetical protein